MDIDDWRNRGQEGYLMGVSLTYKKFKSNLPEKLMPGDDPRRYNDHEHCDFCWHKFMEDCKDVEDCSSEGYCTLNEKIWICKKCYNDFRDKFHWTVINELNSEV